MQSLLSSPGDTGHRWIGGLILCLLVIAGLAGPVAAQPDQAALEARVAELFARSCARSGCHAGPVPQMEMTLTPEQFAASTIGVPSRERPELLRVHPGEPDSSYLMMKVRGDADIVGVQMPLTGDRLSEDEIATLEDWIRGLTEADVGRSEAATTAIYPFHGWKVMNLPTTRTLDAGSWLFLIGHRFNPRVQDGYDAFYGLDGSAIIYLSLGYALTDHLLVALARSNAGDDVELQLRHRLVQQEDGGWPVGAALQGGVNWITEELAEGSRFRAQAYKPSLQLSLTRALGDRGGIAVVPGVLVNPDEAVDGEAPLVTLGLGGRWRFYGNLALVGEWVPIVSGYTLTTTFGNFNRFDSWGGGLEITTGGHVFQIVVANSVGLATDQYMRGGDLDVQEGDVRLGFNIFRILNF